MAWNLLPHAATAIALRVILKVASVAIAIALRVMLMGVSHRYRHVVANQKFSWPWLQHIAEQLVSI